jgi:succinate dehydrogenase/fumarate reductase-like Fe-S protein
VKYEERVWKHRATFSIERDSYGPNFLNGLPKINYRIETYPSLRRYCRESVCGFCAKTGRRMRGARVDSITDGLTTGLRTWTEI